MWAGAGTTIEVSGDFLHASNVPSCAGCPSIRRYRGLQLRSGGFPAQLLQPIQTLRVSYAPSFGHDATDRLPYTPSELQAHLPALTTLILDREAYSNRASHAVGCDYGFPDRLTTLQIAGQDFGALRYLLQELQRSADRLPEFRSLQLAMPEMLDYLSLEGRTIMAREAGELLDACRARGVIVRPEGILEKWARTEV